MRKTLLLLANLLVTLSTNAQSTFFPGDVYADWGQLKLVDNQLSSRDGKPVQLKGWSTQELQLEAMDGCTGADQWHLMHLYGANVVRLAMGVDKPGAYLSNPESWKSKIKNSISEIAEEGMYCVVDWHILKDTGRCNPNDYLDESKDFFGEISKYCADKGYSNVLYEICNRPYCGWDSIKIYAEDVIPVILENQPEALVIVGTDSWCQKVTEPVHRPIDSRFKQNVMYSFHYSACSHFALLGDFRVAQNELPVFVSEWSIVNYDGTGPVCESNGNELLASCDMTGYAPQLVSWCFWNWGKGNDVSSSFKGSCELENLSKYDGTNSNPQVGEYAVKVIIDYVPCGHDCHLDKGSYEIQNIPTKDSYLWHWNEFDLGGEGLAYHDENSSAYIKDADGNYIDYAIGDECDAYSQAYKLNLLNKKNPWYKLTGDGKNVEKYDSLVKCTWDGKESYLSLNAGKKTAGVAGSGRPDDGVDLGSATLLGTPFEYKGYNYLMSVEPGEWINYTVDVEEPGYYKVEAYVSDECLPGEISFSQERGNIVRSLNDLENKEDYKFIHFEKPKACADENVNRNTDPWDCWALNPALDNDDMPMAVLVFVEEGEQELRVNFNSPNTGIGPLVFTKVEHENVEEVLSESEGTADGFTIAPNPTSGEFTVTIARAGKVQIDVVNVVGQVVYSDEIEGSATINKALTSGVYTVVVKSNDGVNTQKLVVK